MDRSITFGRIALRRHSDERIFERAVAGDPMAFSEVYRRYHPRIYAFCLARLMDRDAASDAAQEVFLRLLRAEPDSIGRPRAWMFTVARNVVIDVVRARQRNAEDLAAPEHEEAMWETLATADSAEEMMTREGARNVFLALRRLRPRYRTALILREMHGQSSADIGDALGLKPGAVDTLVSRARDAFGKAYAEVSDLSRECRDAVALMYRRDGTGLSNGEEARLSRHLERCERCRAEEKRAKDPKRMPALLPLLLPSNPDGSSFLAEAVRMSGGIPETLFGQAPVLTSPATWNPVMQVVGTALAATLVVAPVAAKVATDPTPTKTTVSAPAASSRTSSSTTPSKSQPGVIGGEDKERKKESPSAEAPGQLRKAGKDVQLRGKGAGKRAERSSANAAKRADRRAVKSAKESKKPAKAVVPMSKGKDRNENGKAGRRSASDTRHQKSRSSDKKRSNDRKS